MSQLQPRHFVQREICGCPFIWPPGGRRYTTYLMANWRARKGSWYLKVSLNSSRMALQPGVGLGLLYNVPPGPLNSLLCLSIRLHPPFSGPWTRLSTISFLVFLFVLLHTAFRTSFFGIAVSCILSIWPSHHILSHLINLTMFSSGFGGLEVACWHLVP